MGLADEKKKSAELCIQLQTMKKQVSDSPLQEFTSEEKNPEILRLSTLIECKETHLKVRITILKKISMNQTIVNPNLLEGDFNAKQNNLRFTAMLLDPDSAGTIH